MALKEKITAKEYSELDGLKAAYKEDGDDWILDFAPAKSAGTVDETGELKRALQREKQDRRDAQAELRELKGDSDDESRKKLLKTQDIDKLTKAHGVDLKKRDETLTKRDNFIKNELIDAKVESVSKSLAGDNAEALAPHVLKRLSVDFSGEDPELVVLDKDGNPGATIEDLKKDLLDTKYLASILVGSKATGSGASGTKSSSSAQTAKKFNDWKSADLKKLREDNPAEYDKLKAARDS
jgi:hypothetical protein